MKHLLLLIGITSVCILSAGAVSAQTGKAPPKAEFDAKLAEKLGADEYGMRTYVLAVLKTGPAKIDDDEERGKIFKGHFSNMRRLSGEGKLVLAGPFIEGGNNRGLYIFNVDTIEKALKLVESDPAVKAGVFVFELTRWYGSAGLVQLNEIHPRIQKKQI